MKPEPWEQHWQKLEAAAAAGRSLYHVAHDELGTSLSAFRRQDRDRYAACQETADEAREAIAEQRAEQWAVEADAPWQMRSLYVKANSARYRRGDHVSGQLEVTTPDLSASIDRFTALTDAAVRALARAGTREALGRAERRDEGSPRLAVARVVGTSEPT